MSEQTPVLPIGGHSSLEGLYLSPFLINQIMVLTPPPSTRRQEIRDFLVRTDKELVIHAPYTINLAQAGHSGQGKRSIEIMTEQILMANELVPPGKTIQVVFHVGKSNQLSIEDAMTHFYHNLEMIMKSCPLHIQILLETPAGQGSEMFVDLDQFFAVYQYFRKYPNFGLCADTCHLFSAGNRIETFLARPELTQTPCPIKLIHLNDSQTPFHSRVDRHANLGTGTIFLPGTQILDQLVIWARDQRVPMVLETNPEFHQEEVKLLYEIAYPGQQITYLLTSTDTSELSLEEMEEEPVRSEMDLNQKIVHILSILGEAAEDRFRKKALKDAVETVRGLGFVITHPSQVKGVKGIGKGSIYGRIEEIFQTGTLKEFEEKREELEAIDTLSKISGIGAKTAYKLYHDHGVKSIDELVDGVNSGQVTLTRAQLSGLKHFWDIRLRIPREEISRFDQWFKDLLYLVDSQASHLVVGSYRRGRPDSGDIDVLFRHPDLITTRDTHASDLLDRLLALMQEAGAIDSILSHGKSKVLMIAHLPGSGSTPISRRIDFLLTPTESYAAACLYFTGSKFFNVVTRHRAIQLGYKLNEYGLYYRDGNRIPTVSEEDILSIIGVKYFRPEEREENLLRGKYIYIDPIAPESIITKELKRERLEETITDDDTVVEIETTISRTPREVLDEVKALGLRGLLLILDTSKMGDPERQYYIDKGKEILTSDIAPERTDRIQFYKQAITELREN